jgi:CRP/FNR family transcriptional regulator, cyclic AMP receptor protein
MGRMPSKLPELLQGGRVRVLDADPSLGAGLSGEELSVARGYAVADTVKLPRGTYHPHRIFDGGGLLGLLVLDGLLVRRVAVGGRRCGELVGPGALLRPWDDSGQIAPLAFEVSWRVIQETRLAQLDSRFLTTIVHWPTLIETFTARATERTQTLSVNVAINCLRHMHLRLLALLWHLADRFGRVSLEGTHVPLPLTHADLAELVGAQRPSVSNALKRLVDEGLVSRAADSTWMLSHEPLAVLSDRYTRKASSPRTAGDPADDEPGDDEDLERLAASS